MDSADLIKNFMLCTPFHLHYTNTHHKSQDAFPPLQNESRHKQRLPYRNWYDSLFNVTQVLFGTGSFRISFFWMNAIMLRAMTTETKSAMGWA